MTKDQIKLLVVGLIVAVVLIVGFLFLTNNARATYEQPPILVDECVDVYAPDPETFEVDVKPGGGVINATFKWFEGPEGTWTLNMDINPIGGQETWVTTYPAWWFLGKPVNLPQTIVEYECPKPPADVCENIAGTQESTPANMDNEQGYCSCQEGFHRDYGEEAYAEAGDNDYFTCEPDEPKDPPGPPGNPPTFAGSSTEAPQCGEGQTTNVVANPHVWRNGSDATVNFFITEGDSANIFYSVVGQPHWGNAVHNVKPNSDKFVSYTIHDLDPNLGYDFGIQQVRGCGGGKTTAVVVDGPEPVLFQFSYWE